MTDAATDPASADADRGVPSNLYIYYLSGRFPSGVRMPENGFIGNWEEGDTSFLFFSRPAGDDVHRLVAAAADHVTLQDHYQMTYADWQGGVPSTQSIGSFCVMTPWATEANTSEQTLVIDPGVVFGSGQHPTTHDCLAALELAFGKGRVQRMMDLGTGTGILAVAGARLGCRQVLAADLNRLAARTAYLNVLRNQQQDRVVVVAADALTIADKPADLLVANIHYAVMRQLVGRRQVMTNKRAFILSGLLRGEAKDIRFVLSTLGVKILQEWHRDGIWFTFYAERE